MHNLFAKLPAGVTAELQTYRLNAIGVSYSNSQFEEISNNRKLKTDLRVMQNGRISTASSTKPNYEEELLTRALATVPYGSEVNYQLPGASMLANLKLVDERVVQVETKTMVDIADELNQALLDFDSRLKAFVGVEKRNEEVVLQNSNGFVGSFQRSVWQVYLGCSLVQGDDMLYLGDWQMRCDLSTELEQLKASVIDLVASSRQVVPMEAGSYPVIFVPSQVGHLIEPFIACLNGKAIMRGTSPWKEKLGVDLLDPRVTLLDDATLPMQPSSKPFDREGVPTRRNTLINAGIPHSFQLDLQSAAELGMKPTGNGTAAGPAPNHTVLLPGQTPLQELISGIDRGLIIHESMGAWAGNPYSGNVSGTISLGLKIEGGEIVGRVKDCMFSINSFNHFRNQIIDFSQEVKDLGSATLPYVALSDVVISTK